MAAIVVKSSGTILAHDIRWARSFSERSRGLIGSPALERGQALVLEPGTQVHTFRMSHPIDVVFCDKGWVVKHVVRAMPPRRLSKFVFGSRYVIEMPGGTLDDEVEPGTRLALR